MNYLYLDHCWSILKSTLLYYYTSNKVPWYYHAVLDIHHGQIIVFIKVSWSTHMVINKYQVITMWPLYHGTHTVVFVRLDTFSFQANSSFCIIVPIRFPLNNDLVLKRFDQQSINSHRKPWGMGCVFIYLTVDHWLINIFLFPTLFWTWALVMSPGSEMR